MDNFDSTNTPSSSSSKRKKVKLIFFIVLIVIIFSLGLYGYLWVLSTQKMRIEAQNTIRDAQNFKSLEEKIKTEKSRCENFISQKEGDFGSFEYCQKFIDWTNTN